MKNLIKSLTPVLSGKCRIKAIITMIIIGILTTIPNLSKAQEKLPTFDFGSDYKIDTIYKTGSFDVKPLPTFDFGNNGSHIDHPIEDFGQNNQANAKPPYIFGELVTSCATNKGYMTMTMSNMKLWLFQNGDYRLSYTVEIHIGRVGSGCTGAAGERISLLLFDKNWKLLYRIDQKIWFNTGTSYPDNTMHDNELARIYASIGNVRIEALLEPKIVNCPENHSFPTPRWPF